MPAFDRALLPRELRPFVDDDGRLTRWPTRQKVQKQAIALLAARFEPGREYGEREVNERLSAWHTFGDWAILRRALFDWRFLDREADGSRYRLRDRLPWGLDGEPLPPAAAPVAGPPSHPRPGA
jgi:hypothetical protein